MFPTLEHPRRQEATSLPERLQHYSRYVALVAEQLEALGSRDLGRMQRIEEERLRIEREWGESDEGRPNEQLSALLRSGLSELASQADSEEEERERWTLIQTGALQAAHSLHQPPLRIGSYGAMGSAEAKVDVRF